MSGFGQDWERFLTVKVAELESPGDGDDGMTRGIATNDLWAGTGVQSSGPRSSREPNGRRFQ